MSLFVNVLETVTRYFTTWHDPPHTENRPIPILKTVAFAFHVFPWLYIQSKAYELALQLHSITLIKYWQELSTATQPTQQWLLQRKQRRKSSYAKQDRYLSCGISTMFIGTNWLSVSASQWSCRRRKEVPHTSFL